MIAIHGRQVTRSGGDPGCLSEIQGGGRYCVFGSPGPHIVPWSAWQPAQLPMYSP